MVALSVTLTMRALMYHSSNRSKTKGCRSIAQCDDACPSLRLSSVVNM